MVPEHIGFIMDGNRRWAKERGLPVIMGHKKGQEAIREILHAVFGAGVRYATVYAFSTENWSRDQKEVGYLMTQVVKALGKYVDEFDQAGVKVVFLGELDELSEGVREAIRATEQQTRQNTKATLGICFNYGGQKELVSAIKKIVQDNVAESNITEEMIAERLYHPEIPPCDLIVRTSGEERLSNFMLWRAAYSELFFIDKFWPEMTKQDVTDILKEYSRRNRRFGG